MEGHCVPLVAFGRATCFAHATWSAAHWGVCSRWHWLQVLGTPSCTVCSGRGTRKLWSCRESMTMNVERGM
jgi:hypothetical protein